ncbi:DUF3995 domain-containing protein [Rhizobium sp. KAs_5_22]|uniref:DUF3995 domain-containing protein n=1 Tax=Ciceribacter selenitireducens TaxID=448181 RepID=UPI000491FE79|nr:DUF3995 domain-containing protein [Ciceribacter selenitireducens]PPJ45813.1 DUF3995 domain-containing protein [Rhizobium sp. KAs_5_22]
MSTLAVFLAVVLLAIAVLHLAWAAGSTFPATSEGDLARMVAGFADRDHMPPRPASALVAGALGVVAYVALALGSVCGWPFWTWSLPAAGVVVAFVFLARGVAAYVPAWRALVPQEPFASLDRRYYGPLCLVIGVGFTLLATGYTA